MRRARAAMVAALAAWLVMAGAPARAVNDPGFNRQWGMSLIGAPDAWATGRGAGITIAVVDTGVQLTHEDLAAKVVAGANFIDPGKPPVDDNGHGTHVSGIAAALTDNGRGVVGVAPDAKIMPIKVLDANGSASAATGSANTVDEGIRYAADHHAQVINLSLGDVGQGIVFSPSFTDSIEYAWQHGSICVVAAGNNFASSSGFGHDTDAVVVSAVDRHDAKPDYSSGVGDVKWGIAAPGGGSTTDLNQDDEIFSTIWDSNHPDSTNYYGYLSGTSMAAPHVAGALAVLLGLGLDRTTAVNRLLATAKDLGPAGTDTTFGAGRLDVAKAVAGLGSGAGGAGGGGGTSAPGSTSPTTAGRTGGSHHGSGTTAATAAPAVTGPSSTVTPSTSGLAAGTGGADPRADGIAGAQPLGRAAHTGRPWALAALAAVLLAAAASGVRAQARARPG